MFTYCKKIGAALLGLLISGTFFSCSKPGDTDVQNGVTAYGAGRYAEALEYFNKSLEQETRYSKEMIYNFMSNSYAAEDNIEAAAEYLEKALDGKNDYRGFVTLGSYYQSLKNFEKAETSIKKAIAMNEKKGEGWATLGILYLEENRNDEAVDCLEKGVLYAPQIAVIYANLALAYAKTGNKAKSDEAFAKAEEMQCVNLDQFEEKIRLAEKQ